MSAASKILDGIWYSVILLIVAAIALGAIINKPILVSYATSDSMEPTMSVGDLFFIQPQFSTRIGVGDIVVYKSSKGEYLTHRVVAESGDGFFTHGDNSPFTDQQAGEPVVTTETIAGKVLTFQGKPLLIPKGGIWIEFLSFYVKRNALKAAALILALGVASIFVDQGTKSRKRLSRPKRSKLTLKHLALPALLLLLIVSSAFMLLGRKTVEIEYIVTESEPDGEWTMGRGQVFEKEIEFVTGGLFPYFAFVDSESERVSLGSSAYFLRPRSTERVSLSVRAEDKIGYYTKQVQVRRYLPLLPPSMIQTLFESNPYLPILVLDLELLAPFVLLFLAMGPNERLRLKSRSLVRWKRKLRRSLL